MPAAMHSNQSPATSSSSSMRPTRSPLGRRDAGIQRVAAFPACGSNRYCRRPGEARRRPRTSVSSCHRSTRCPRRARARRGRRRRGGAQAVERPAQQRFAIERRQDDVEDHHSHRGASRPPRPCAAAGASSMASYNSSTARAVARAGLVETAPPRRRGATADPACGSASACSTASQRSAPGFRPTARRRPAAARTLR